MYSPIRRIGLTARSRCLNALHFCPDLKGVGVPSKKVKSGPSMRGPQAPILVLNLKKIFVNTIYRSVSGFFL